MKSGLGAVTRAVPKHLCNQLCNELPNMKPLLPYTGTEFLDSLDEHTEEYRRDLRRVEYGDVVCDAVCAVMACTSLP